MSSKIKEYKDNTINLKVEDEIMEMLNDLLKHNNIKNKSALIRELIRNAHAEIMED